MDQASEKTFWRLLSERGLVPQEKLAELVARREEQGGALDVESLLVASGLMDEAQVEMKRITGSFRAGTTRQLQVRISRLGGGLSLVWK